MDIWSKLYWKTTAELALRSFGIGAAAAMTGAPLNAWHLQWDQILGFGVGSALFSVATSLGVKKLGRDDDSPLLSAEPAPPSPV